MKKTVPVPGIIILSAIFMFSCKGGDTNVEQLKKQVDSLTQLTSRQQGDIDDMQVFVTTLAEGLDTIAKQESTLFYTNKGREGTLVDREQLKKNLEAFAQNLEEQREKVRTLTESLKAKGVQVEKLQTLINLLNQQIDEKDKMITQLKRELNNKNANIAQLSSKVNVLSQDNASLSQKVQEQQQQITAQNEKLNTGYLVMGSGKKLKEYGIISGGGLFKKAQVNYASLPREVFTKVDIKTFGGIEIPAARPKLVSGAPSSSYEFVKTGKETSELHILDPEAFWSGGKYVVIQTK